MTKETRKDQLRAKEPRLVLWSSLARNARDCDFRYIYIYILKKQQQPALPVYFLFILMHGK